MDLGHRMGVAEVTHMADAVHIGGQRLGGEHFSVAQDRSILIVMFLVLCLAISSPASVAGSSSSSRPAAEFADQPSPLSLNLQSMRGTD